MTEGIVNAAPAPLTITLDDHGVMRVMHRYEVASSGDASEEETLLEGPIRAQAAAELKAGCWQVTPQGSRAKSPADRAPSRAKEEAVIEAACELVATGFGVNADGTSEAEDALRDAVQTFLAARPPSTVAHTVERACGAISDQRHGEVVCWLAAGHSGEHNTASDGTGDSFPAWRR